jgi:predicted nucleotidyltransferase component of viral defense system
MNQALVSLLSGYTLTTIDEYRNALREIVQNLTLLGLWRAKIFEHVSFYGGTALRIFHGLTRYSEDLDFSLLTPNAGFSLSPFTKVLETELRSFGFEVPIVVSNLHLSRPAPFKACSLSRRPRG